MADITFYFPSAGAAPHNCAYSATWQDVTTAVRYPLLTTRGTTDIVSQNCHKTGTDERGLGGQWVSAALSARSYTTADTFDFVMPCRDGAGSGTARLWMSIRVFNAAGDTVIGTLYEGSPNTVLWATSITSRHCDGVAVQNSVDLPENGHIVVEVGVSDTYGNASFSQNIWPQDLGISGALPLNDTETSQAMYPWLAFTYGAASATNVVLNII